MREGTRATRRRPARAVSALVLLAGILALVASGAGGSPATPDRRARAGRVALASKYPPAAVPGTGAARPRVLFDPGAEPSLQDRLTREPYRTVFLTMHARADSFDDSALGDESVEAQRNLTRAAKIRAFEYALDRTVVGGAIVAFPTPADRKAAGDFARKVLLQLYPRSRLAVPPPIGGWDRDISTSEEIVNGAEAFDTLLGAGYSFSAADRKEVVRRLQSVTQELWTNFTDQSTAHGYTKLHQNNHRTKSGAAMAIAAVVLSDEVPASQARRWFDTGAADVDDVMRHTLITGDGAYAEGTHYYAFTLQNLLPLLSVWERFLGEEAWTTTGGLTIPALAHQPQFARTQRWMLDVTLPDGSLAPFDDANVGRSSYFGALPATLPTDLQAASHWRWANQPQPDETDGNIDLAADSIVAYDDSIAPAAPTWAPTQFYVEGGNAMLRSSWASDATEALILGEHDTASEFGRDRTGTGRYPQSHEHIDPGSFLLQAFGQTLALDPGYLNFSSHDAVNQAGDHNTVLVDGKGPASYLDASFAWAEDPMGRPPAEGQSTIGETLDGAAADVATVATDYRGAAISRRFLFGGDRYLVVSDTVHARSGTAISWMLHGNGGGTSGGTFAKSGAGGTWAIAGARLSSGITTSVGAPSITTAADEHEAPGGQHLTHTALRATADARPAPGSTGAIGGLQVLYPSSTGSAAPTITRSTGAGPSTVSVAAPVDDRKLTVVAPDPGRAGLDPGSSADGITGGSGLVVADRHTDGSLRSAWADDATTLADHGNLLVSTDGPGSLGLSLGEGSRAGTADVVATGGSGEVTVGDVGFVPAGVDGACGISTVDGKTVITMNRERRATLRSTADNSRPAADPGADRRVAVGDVIRLDGTASCDADADPLTYRWELVSAPSGSDWSLTGTTTPSPVLEADATGPYRVRLVVTDSHGAKSLEQEVVIIAGPQCGDGVDDDLDGRIDTDDPDCDGAGRPTTTTTTAPTTSTTSVPGATPPGNDATGAEPIPGDPRYTG